MRWDDFRQSENVEDRTGDGPLAGPGFPLPTGRGGMGLGTIITVSYTHLTLPTNREV